MKAGKSAIWLRSCRALARLFLSSDDDRAAPMQSFFHLDSAEIWRFGQQRRSQYLAALLNRMRSGAVESQSTPIGPRRINHTMAK